MRISQHGKLIAEQTIDMKDSGYDVANEFMYCKAGVYNQNNSGDANDYVQAVILQRQDWSMATGEWIEVYCRATFSESGDLRLIATRLSDGSVVFDINETGLDLWRGESPDHFVRPQWGIYRSILDPDNLRPAEEQVQFANFSISEVTLVD